MLAFLILTQNGFFVWLPLLGCVGLVSFSFKVSLSEECSVLACFVAGPGLALPPASSNRLSISGAGIAAAATPTCGGTHTASTSCNSISDWHGVARFKHRGLAVGNSRKVSETLPARSIQTKTLRRISIGAYTIS